MDFAAFLNKIKTVLDETFDDVTAWFGEKEEVLAYKPKNGGWSIKEVLEHITITSHFLLKLIAKANDKALKNPAMLPKNFLYEGDILQKLEEIGMHHSFPWNRPEHMEPKGNASLTEVKETMKKQQEICHAILEQLQNGEGVEAKTTMSVNGLGKIDVYQYIYFLALHAKRHIAQMERVKKEYCSKAFK